MMATMDTVTFKHWLEEQGFSGKSIDKILEEEFSDPSDLMKLDREDILSLDLKLAQRKLMENIVSSLRNQDAVEVTGTVKQQAVEQDPSEQLATLSVAEGATCKLEHGKMAIEDTKHLQAKRSPELHLVLIGERGSGKSSTGNTIIGENIFSAGVFSKPFTNVWKSFTCTRLNHRMKIVDTQELAPASIEEKDMMIEIKDCGMYDESEMHAILYAMRIDRFTESDKKTIDRFVDYWGQDALKYVIVVFTRLDDIDDEEMSIDEFLSNSDESLKAFLSHINYRYVAVNNKRKSNESFVAGLQKQIIQLINTNSGRCFTNEMLRKHTKQIFETEYTAPVGTVMPFSRPGANRYVEMAAAAVTSLGLGAVIGFELVVLVLVALGGALLLRKFLKSRAVRRL